MSRGGANVACRAERRRGTAGTRRGLGARHLRVAARGTGPAPGDRALEPARHPAPELVAGAPPDHDVCRPDLGLAGDSRGRAAQVRVRHDALPGRGHRLGLRRPGPRRAHRCPAARRESRRRAPGRRHEPAARRVRPHRPVLGWLAGDLVAGRRSGGRPHLPAGRRAASQSRSREYVAVPDRRQRARGGRARCAGDRRDRVQRPRGRARRGRGRAGVPPAGGASLSGVVAAGAASDAAGGGRLRGA